jgi:hypothetical protein
MLEIAAKCSGAPISSLELRLYKSGAIEFTAAKTDSSGKAVFTVPESRKYYLQSVQDSIYLPAELPAFQLTLCQSQQNQKIASSQPESTRQPNASQQPSANATQSASAPCASYSYESCPSSCVVCPPCAVCSSISCQTEEFCASIGFNRSWYEGIRQGSPSKQQPGTQQAGSQPQVSQPPSQQGGSGQQGAGALPGEPVQQAASLAAFGAVGIGILAIAAGIAYFVFFRKKQQ